ncbi:MAG: YgjV family protein [Acidimicrobiales bacterium]
MTADRLLELLGYAASVMIVVSITQKSLFRLRVIGLAGSLSFLAYGLLIGAFPIALVNAAATCIHVYFLYRLTRDTSEVFSSLPVRPDSDYLQAYLQHYGAEIQARLPPGFEYEPRADLITAFVLRDIVPAGLFIGRRVGTDTVEAILDFASPEYRDFRIADYIFSNKAGLFTDRDREVLARAVAPDHVAYLRRVGFSEHPSEPGAFRLALSSKETSP